MYYLGKYRDSLIVRGGHDLGHSATPPKKYLQRCKGVKKETYIEYRSVHRRIEEKRE
jgi:hypothetical protein